MAFSDASWQQTLDITGTTVAVNTPGVFETGDEVYVRAEYDTPGQQTFKQRKLIINAMMFFSDGGGNHVQSDKATAADGTVAADIATDNASNDTNIQYGFFYQVIPSGGGAAEEYHESLLLKLAGANSVRDANDWV